MTVWVTLSNKSNQTGCQKRKKHLTFVTFLATLPLVQAHPWNGSFQHIWNLLPTREQRFHSNSSKNEIILCFQLATPEHLLSWLFHVIQERRISGPLPCFWRLHHMTPSLCHPSREQLGVLPYWFCWDTFPEPQCFKVRSTPSPDQSQHSCSHGVIVASL